MVACVPPGFQFRETSEIVRAIPESCSRRQLPSGEPVLDGADQRCRLPRLVEDGIDQVGGSGFAVRARDAGNPETAIGMVIEIACRGGKSLPPVRNLDPWRIEISRGGEVR